jgi:hypothetical protein
VAIESTTFLRAFPDITGTDKSRAEAVFRAHREHNLIQKCRGKNLAEMNSAEAIMFTFGVIADVPVHRAPDAAKLYYGLLDSERKRSGDEIARMLDSFNPMNESLEYAALSLRSYVVVDLESPRVTLVRECTDGPWSTVFGVKAEKSTEPLIQTSKTISGKCLFELAAILNKDYWDARKKSAA